MRWLLLVHQLPPTPAYLRVKVGRQLARLGAVALKNTVYALPLCDGAREDLGWLRREIVGGGGDAMVLEAELIEGASDEEVVERFRAARDPEYRAIADEVRTLGAKATPRDRARWSARMAELAEIDFFGAPEREVTQGLLAATPPRKGRAAKQRSADFRAAHQGKRWVTRSGVRVDRIASAWLIRRFIDEGARFGFVTERSHPAAADQIRFDMFEGEITHEGDRCTFEVLVARLGSRDRALAAIAEVVHDIDMKDAKYGRPETAGIAAALTGLLATEPDDVARLARGGELFESLYAHFRGGRA